MHSNTEGMMVVLSSPSGAGKTTLVKLIADKKNFIVSVSHTTRKPRENEKNEIDYFFVNKEKFEELKNQNFFLEHARVFENFYGTSKHQVINNLEQKKRI